MAKVRPTRGATQHHSTKRVHRFRRLWALPLFVACTSLLVLVFNLRSSAIVTDSFFTSSASASASASAPLCGRQQSKRPCTDVCNCWTNMTSSSSVLSASSIWIQFREEIYRASLHLDEAENKTAVYSQWISQLFSISTTARLRRAIETLPTDLEGWKSVRDILNRRLIHPESNPPLQVAVMGGSLTAGHGCLDNPLGIPTQSFMKRQVPCAWPSRVQRLLDVFLSSSSSQSMVNITNMAMAATTSDVASTVVDYQLWPPALQPHGPDVIVAAFAINDALTVGTQNEIYQNIQQLIESVHRERNCRSNDDDDRLPILVFVDDFIAWPGNMKQYLDFHQDLHELADWHGLGFVSYANAFRDLVLASDLFNETTFKGSWSIDKKGKTAANPHPGMSFHIFMSWVICYYLLHLSLSLCDGSLDEPTSPEDQELGSLFAVPNIPAVHRPLLDEKLDIEQVHKLWTTLASSERDRCQSVVPGSRCDFVWVANRVSEFRTAKDIDIFLQPFLTNNHGWKAEGNSYVSKHGWVAQKEKARFELQIPADKMNIRYMTILSLQSYGEQWEDTKIHVQVNGKVFTIDGFHNSETSVIVPHKFELPEMVKQGEFLKVVVELVSGSTFKITGMAFCRS